MGESINLFSIPAGVDDFLAQATPEAKLNLIRTYQAQVIWSP